jgi:uncharacterized protein
MVNGRSDFCRGKEKMENSINPVGYFEIPVRDMERAMKFYNTVFGFELESGNIDNIEMAFFPFNEKSSGITGALAKGKIYIPAKEGALIYFNTDSIDTVLAHVNDSGGKTLYPKTPVGEYGFVAEFEDCEGNRIALTEKLK